MWMGDYILSNRAERQQKEDYCIEVFKSIGASMHDEGSKIIIELPDGRKTSFYTIDEVYCFARDLENSIKNELKKLKFNALLIEQGLK